MDLVDLKPEFSDIRDEQRVARDGTVTSQKKVTFYLGKFGPFVERFDAAGFDLSAVQPRISSLQQTILAMHR